MADEQLLKRIDRLESIEAIRTMVARYAEGADLKNDPVILGDLFAEDAIWEANGFGQYFGAKNIAQGLSDIAKNSIHWSLHYMVSPKITIDEQGDAATCDWYLWELARVSENQEPAKAHWVGGTYASKVKRIHGVWKFQHVSLTLKLLSPLDVDWKTLPSV